VSEIPQPDFLNTVALGHTTWPPERVLAFCKDLEREAGRDLSPEAPRNGPRPLDVDVLWLGGEVRDDPAPTLPHPRLTERWFVLAPLADVAAGTVVPGTGGTVARWLAALPETAGEPADPGNAEDR
jgi:2-amino-4-hydroxy-6-hydroxymethyldihydropteridine diphosphokinase